MCNKMIQLLTFVLVTGLICGMASADPLHQDDGPDGIVSIEAENFDDNIPGNNPHTWDLITESADGFVPPEGFSGGAAMQAQPTVMGGGGSFDADFATRSPRLDFEVNFVKTGTHYVWLLAYGMDGNSDSLHAGLGGEEVPSADRIDGINVNYTWTNSTRDPEPATIEITKTGIQTVNIWMRESGVVIDKIVLTTNPDYTPTGSGPDESHRGVIVKAHNPKPSEGEVYLDIWANLSWTAGATAASHDVYFSDNFDAVNDGTTDAFQGNQIPAFLIVGMPGFAYPDGLVPGTTYYWRVDEVETDGTKIYRGLMWSFTIPPKIAYEPAPADGARFIDIDTSLSWTAGFGTKMHFIHFGDNFEDVNNSETGTVAGTNSYTPGALEANKTYYWRVDEFDSISTYKGKVWSFKTAKVGGGIRGEYFNGMNFENLVLTRTDPQIDFIWGDSSSPDALVRDDSFSVRWSGEVEAPFTETYTFYTNSDDGVRLWVDGQMLVDNWTDHGATEDYGSIDLAAGNMYPVVMEYYDNTGGATAELRWESASTPKQLIPQAALSPPVRASEQNPANGAIDVSMAPVLKWKSGDFASSHDVYFGTDTDAVQSATTVSPEYKGNLERDSESFAPGDLQPDSTYYWRIDEINDTNPDSPWTGNVMSFTTGDYLTVDDFESYNDLEDDDPESNRIFNVWIDGYNNPANGSLIGHDNAPFAERSIVRTGTQSMPYFYDTNMKYSEAQLTLTPGQNWSRLGVTVLSLSFLGDGGNSVEPMYVKINGKKILYDGDAADITRPRWHLWNIDLGSLGINLQNVTTLIIGFGNDTNPTAGGTGVVYFDDIRLHQTAPVVAAPSSEEIWIEAEDADTITQPFEIYTDVAKASGGKCIGTTDDVGNSGSAPPHPDGTATYNFTVAGGTYRISCRIIIPDGDSFWFRLQGATTQTVNHSSGWIRWSDPPNSNVWYWNDVFSAEDDGETVLFTMEPGTYTLEVGYREDAALMDTIVISKVE